MKIKKKNYISFIIIILIYIFGCILFFSSYNELDDWRAKFGSWLFCLGGLFIVPYLLDIYLNSFSTKHTLKIENENLIFDGKRFKIDDNLHFRLKENLGEILVKLYIGKNLIFDYINFSLEEFDRFLYIVKPYLKNPKIVENINFQEIKPFKRGFFIKHKKYFYECLEDLIVYKSETKDLPLVLKIKMIYKGKSITKNISYNEENIQKLVFIIIKHSKPLSFKYFLVKNLHPFN